MLLLPLSESSDPLIAMIFAPIKRAKGLKTVVKGVEPLCLVSEVSFKEQRLFTLRERRASKPTSSRCSPAHLEQQN